MDDIEAIKQLRARLQRTTDDRDFAAMRECLADDYVVTIGEGRVVKGADTYVDFVERAVIDDDLSTLHLGHAPIIALTSDTTATGTWLIQDQVRYPDGREMLANAVADERYVKVAGAWLVESAALTAFGAGAAHAPGRTHLSAAAVSDRLAITDRLHQYCYAMDRIDHELGYGVWHPDGTADYAGIFRGTGREFVDWVHTTHVKMSGRSHQVTNIRIELDGDRATSEAYVTACLRFRSRDTVVRGRYLDTWSRRDGEWRIDARRFEEDLVQIIPVHESQLPAGEE